MARTVGTGGQGDVKAAIERSGGLSSIAEASIDQARENGGRTAPAAVSCQPTFDLSMSRWSMCSLIWPPASLVTPRCSRF